MVIHIDSNKGVKHNSHLLKKFKAKKNLNLFRLRFKRKATTYSPTIGSTIGANGLNFSVRDGKR